MLPHVNLEDRTVEGSGIDLIGFIQYVYTQLTNGDWNSLLETLGVIWNIYSVIAILLSILFFAGFIYAKIRLSQLGEEEHEHFIEEEAEWRRMYTGEASQNSRWDEIQKHTKSDNPNDWRLAIIEADILLEETLTNAGFIGVSIGDKLKTASSSSFQTLQDAWEAHKVRNEIAHAGSDFVLTKRMATDTIVRFERVFREFNVI